MTYTKNILVLVLIAFVLSIQLWLFSIFALPYFPLKSTLTQIVVPEWWHEIIIKRDALHFHIFVFFSLGLTAMIFGLFRRRMKEAGFMSKARLFFI